MTASTAQLTHDEVLSPDALSALMRSTWTWDDRALRRDMAALLVELGAARAAGSRPESAPGGVLRARAHSTASRFVATVLGPRLIADTDNPLRPHYVALATEPAHFERAAAAALVDVRRDAADYVTEQTRELDYPDASSWMTLVADDGARGLGAAMRAFGNTLSASNFFSSVGLAWQTLKAVVGESELADEYAEKLLSESVSATLAAAEKTGSWDPAMVKTRAVETDEGWRLSGVKEFVPAAADAELIFVIARSTAGPSLFAVDATAAGLSVTPLDVTDPTRALSRVELSDTPARLLGREGAGGRLMVTAIDLATTALAAEQVGLIERAMSVLMANRAKLPDAPSFENRLAEVVLDHVAAASLWRHALAEQAAGSQLASASAAAAHIGCSAAAVRVATATAQLLGPSDDSNALFRRAQSGSLLFGGPALSHERLLERLGV
jgi:alkylation response protein AidB-like acyl-CoA dehydrogenase